MRNSFSIFIKSTIFFLVGLGFLLLFAIALRMLTSVADAAALPLYLYLGAAVLGFLSFLAICDAYPLAAYQEADISQDAEQSGHDFISNEQQAFDALLRCRVMCAHQILPTISEPI